jgi:hypothetical protein
MPQKVQEANSKTQNDQREQTLQNTKPSLSRPKLKL